MINCRIRIYLRSFTLWILECYMYFLTMVESCIIKFVGYVKVVMMWIVTSIRYWSHNDEVLIMWCWSVDHVHLKYQLCYYFSIILIQLLISTRKEQLLLHRRSWDFWPFWSFFHRKEHFWVIVNYFIVKGSILGYVNHTIIKKKYFRSY